MNEMSNQPLRAAADPRRYTLTAEQVSNAISGHDIRTFKGWTAAASSLLADAPLMTGIQEKHSPYMILKAEFNGKPEVVSFTTKPMASTPPILRRTSTAVPGATIVGMASELRPTSLH